MAIISAWLKSKKKITFDEFIERLSDIADDFMNKENKTLGINYIGGDCIIKREKNSPKKIIVNIEMYGTVENDNWKKSQIKLERNLRLFTDDENTVSALNKLLKEPLKFKVEPPKKEN